MRLLGSGRSCAASCLRLLQQKQQQQRRRRCSGCVWPGLRGSEREELRAKLQPLGGGSVELQLEESGVAVLTINNPQRINAFSGSMMLQLEEKVSVLESWSQGRGLILHGAAGNFCSGSDLAAVRAIADPQDGMKMCMFMQDTLTRLLRLPLISVALVEGRALGGGAELTTACDFRLMAPGSVIQFVHKHMGLVPGWGGASRLVDIVGRQNSLKLLAGALKVDPESGLRMGLADGVLEATGTPPLRAAHGWLSTYTAAPAPVVRAVKRAVRAGSELPPLEALRKEKEVFGTVWGAAANRQALAGKHKHK